MLQAASPATNGDVALYLLLVDEEWSPRRTKITTTLVRRPMMM
jgi:hypothetical protein